MLFLSKDPLLESLGSQTDHAWGPGYHPSFSSGSYPFFKAFLSGAYPFLKPLLSGSYPLLKAIIRGPCPCLMHV